MPKFEVELKKVVDDSYEIEIGHGLLDLVVADAGCRISDRCFRVPGRRKK